ncbi:putative aminoacyltransferase, E1 ubiquitin-activating enzyme [Senna tora]|uniref:Putative aminoacyltransferase, E1 ubiquitin-activating enzyme n=1 Tax=Senna tora TaxID=362788 RepID=A0A834WJP9_9FABA|nr:putative aminoacyltransferase, E1 ubiquitin-activating enzyme [Senna tora]
MKRLAPPRMANRTDENELQTLLSEQSEEFTMAKALASDSDLAFQLQMQEAVNASLASQPSASSPSQTAIFTDDDDKASAAVDLAVSLMLEDTKRFTQELKDREHSQAEMAKMMEDLDRRIFDQNFARNILNIPKEEWRKNGDNFHMPYDADGAASSSSLRSTSLAAECFKVYCKGLVSEERVRDMSVKVASIGIAICDSRDYLIFEVKKPLDVMETGGVVLTTESAELQAVVEGLVKALDLGLQRVTFFCDDYMLYQYVTGRVLASRNSKFAGLLDQVFNLQRKFVYCVPSLAARKDVKYAFKSARDAIVSQIKWSAETDKGTTSFKETCAICFEDTDVDKMFSVDHCLHRYCFSCMKQHVEVKLLNGMMAKCPHEGCNSEVTVDRCRKFLAPELVEVISQRMEESAIPVSEKVYCPFPKCSALMSKRKGLGVPWHYNMTCYQYSISNPRVHAQDDMVKSLANKKLWRQCVKCNHIIELAEGVGMNFVTHVENHGRTRKQHALVQSGMRLTSYVIGIKEEDNDCT